MTDGFRKERNMDFQLAYKQCTLNWYAEVKVKFESGVLSEEERSNAIFVLESEMAQCQRDRRQTIDGAYRFLNQLKDV